MARCEECLHYDLCSYNTYEQAKYFGKDKEIYITIKNNSACKFFKPTADVAPKSEEGAECPTCHGTGRIGTTDWLTKNISKEQLAKEKAEAIAEHELYIKQDYAREIFEEIEKDMIPYVDHEVYRCIRTVAFNRIKKEYTEG